MLGPLNELDVALEDPAGLVRLIRALPPRDHCPALKQVKRTRPDLRVTVYQNGEGSITRK
jgi:hypothetical protein